MFSFFHFTHLQRNSLTHQGRSSSSTLMSSSENMRKRQQFQSVSGFQKPIFMTFFKGLWWLYHSEMQHYSCCRLGTGARQWALGSSWVEEPYMFTLLANAPKARAQGEPGDHSALMLSRDDWRAGTVSREKVMEAHYCLWDGCFELCLSISHKHWPVVSETGWSEEHDQ